MKNVLILIFFVFLFILPLFAETQQYDISPELSSLTFDTSAQIHHVHGVSNAFTGVITGDSDDITSAKIIVKLDPKTFDTDNKSRDKVMRGKSLEIEKYPWIEFDSSAIEAIEGKLHQGHPINATIKGVLRLHGLEKEISLPIKILWDGNVMGADGDLALQLDDYKIFRPKILFFRLQNDVKIHFHIGARKTAT